MSKRPLSRTLVLTSLIRPNAATGTGGSGSAVAGSADHASEGVRWQVGWSPRQPRARQCVFHSGVQSTSLQTHRQVYTFGTCTTFGACMHQVSEGPSVSEGGCLGRTESLARMCGVGLPTQRSNTHQRQRRSQVRQATAVHCTAAALQAAANSCDWIEVDHSAAPLVEACRIIG